LRFVCGGRTREETKSQGSGGQTRDGPVRNGKPIADSYLALTPPEATRKIRGFFLRTPASRWACLARSEVKRFTVDLGSFHGSGGLGEIRRVDADNFSTRPEGPRAACGEDRVARAAALAAEARRVHARLHDDAEETQLGAAQGRARAPDQRDRSDDV